jgi:hypothetical protein
LFLKCGISAQNGPAVISIIAADRSTSVEFGVAIGANTGIPDFAREAEDSGFDFLGCGEHVMFHRPVLNTGSRSI